MRLVQYKTVLAAGLVLATCQAGAVQFISLDPRVNAMGGAGVAAASGAGAVFTNPALLMVRDPQDATTPVVGLWRSSNPRNVRDEVERYQRDNLEANFETALTNFKADPSTPSIRNKLAEATQNLTTQLKRISSQAAEKDIGAGVAVGVGNKMALLADIQIISTGKVVNAEQDYNTYVKLISEGLNKNLPSTDAAFNVIVSGPDRNLQTMLLSRGATITELGLAMSKEITIAGHKMAAGVTPKYVNIDTSDYEHTVNIALFNANEGRQQYSSFNLDLGLAKEHGDGWKSGITIKNLIPREYQTLLGNNIAIEPQLRAGVAYASKWFTTAADLDLNESKALGHEVDTQYLGLGAEADFSRTIKLRAGYRYNISDRQTSAVTVGTGVALLGAPVDVAMTINEDEWEFSARLGVQF